MQVVGWAKMFSDYAKVMPAGEAFARTFDGSEACDFCTIAATGEKARQQLPQDTILGGGEKFLLAHEVASPFVFATVPAAAWPGADAVRGLTRSDSVPVPPPRA